MSHLAAEMASPRTLRDWCRVTCASYPSVDIKNMSSSFRDGLAFCAIIHKHRPELIDFSSLSKDNVYQNNKLAFEVAETKLGIPALLDPKDMVSTEVPDCLSVISYLSQYYSFFSGKSSAGPARLWSSHVTVLNNLTRSKSSDGLKRLKSLTDLETSREDGFSNTRPRTVCHLCFKPVHLIQRHLIDGKIYHRSCFRCTVCHSTLLPESYRQGSDANSLICTYHVTDSNPSQQVGSADNRTKFQASYYSLDGLAITSVPHYSQKPELQDRLVCKTDGTKKQERSRGVKEKESRNSSVGPPRPPQPSVKDQRDINSPSAAVVDYKVQQNLIKTSEVTSSCGRVTEQSSRPVPTPRRTVDPSVVPVPAPRIKTSQTMNSSPAAGSPSSRSQSPSSPSHITSPKVKTNHPWMTIVHPGPWTQLPPAPAPVPLPRSKSVSSIQGPWNRPRMPPPNPFDEEEEEEEEEDTQEETVKPDSAAHTKPSVAAVQSENGGDTTAVVSSSDAENPVIESEENKVKPQNKPIPPKKPDFKEGGGVVVPDPAKGGTAVTDKVGASSELAGDSRHIDSSDVTEAAGEPCPTSHATQILPRSLSVPAITSDCCQSPSVLVRVTQENEAVSSVSCQSKPACKENPFDRKPEMPKSKTFQDLSSSRGAAPGHGFPLIKRKVQTDQYVSTEELQVQMKDLDKHLEALEQRGVDLERNLRDCQNDKEQEQMLTEWFSLIHERHVLLRRDTELVYLTKQQKLEDRQTDVEYELRCLLNKPESDWSQEDRGREQQLMDELVTIIDQRNQIVSSLEQDRQREREEDVLWEGMVKNKDLQKEAQKDLKKSKGKFKPTKIFKLLNHKAESSKDSVDKKS